MYTRRVAYTNRWASGPGPVPLGGDAATGGAGIVVSCRGHQPPLVIAQGRVHATNVEWLPSQGTAPRPDGHGNMIVTCPTHGEVRLTAMELTRASNRVRRRWRSVGMLVNPNA